MNKQLLVDYSVFEISPQSINESLSQNNGKLIVNGVLQRAESKNQNGRIYPKETLMREASNYAGTFIKERRALGELDHPDSSVVNLANVSHNILDMGWQGNDLVGKVEVLGTHAGNILKELFKSGSFINPSQPVVVLGFSKYTLMTMYILSFTCSANLFNSSAYSFACKIL